MRLVRHHRGPAQHTRSSCGRRGRGNEDGRRDDVGRVLVLLVFFLLAQMRRKLRRDGKRRGEVRVHAGAATPADLPTYAARKPSSRSWVDPSEVPAARAALVVGGVEELGRHAVSEVAVRRCRTRGTLGRPTDFSGSDSEERRDGGALSTLGTVRRSGGRRLVSLGPVGTAVGRGRPGLLILLAWA